MGGLWSFFQKKDPKTPIKGIGPKIKNMFVVHHKGLIGTIVPLVVMIWQFQKNVHSKTVEIMWMTMFWFFLIRPVNIPVTGLIPTFMLPLAGAMKTDMVCGCYMNESVILFILGSMLILLWNNCGLDRRIALWFMCAGDTVQFSAAKLILKTSMAAFFLGMLSSRLISCSIITQYMTTVLTDMQGASTKATEPNFKEMRYIINCAIASSSAIGSIAVVHASPSTIAFRAIFYGTVTKDKLWPDIFNYLEYTIFAFPLALTLFIFNTAYYILLSNMNTGNAMSTASMNAVRNALLNHKKSIPKSITLHEKLAIFFTIASFAMFLFRWNKYLNGWSYFENFKNLPLILDATVAGFFVVLLHALPSGYRFTKILFAKKRSQLGPIKAESGILWFNFVDKNTNYSYIFLIGSGVALSTAIQYTGLNKIISSNNPGKSFASQELTLYILIITLVAVILANIMSGASAAVIFIPLIMHMNFKEAFDDAGAVVSEGAVMLVDEINDIKMTLEKLYLGSLAAGVATSCGFMYPFLYTPAYFCHYTGKVPMLKMIMYGLGSAIISFLFVFVFVGFYAPVLWDKDAIQFKDSPPKPTPKPKVPPADAAGLFI